MTVRYSDVPSSSLPVPPILLSAAYRTGSSQFTLTMTTVAYPDMVLLYGAGPTLAAQGTPDRAAFRLLGTLPSLSMGVNDISARYLNKFRAPEAGEKVSVRLVGVSLSGFRTRPIIADTALVTTTLAATGPEPGLTLKAA